METQFLLLVMTAADLSEELLLTPSAARKVEAAARKYLDGM